MENLTFDAGSGVEVLFWKDSWVGKGPLCIRFNRLLSVDINQDTLVQDIGDGKMERPSRWEEELLAQLKHIISQIVVKEDDSDVQQWKA